MKRLFAFMMAMAMMLSLSVTAFAENQNDGTITITNATVGKTYRAYKIFNASLAEGTTGGIAYTIDEEITKEGVTTSNYFFDEMFTKQPTADDAYYNPFFVYNPNTGGVVKKTGVNDAELVNYLKGLIYDKTTEEKDGVMVDVYTEKAGIEGYAEASATAGDSTVVFDNLPYGYYLVTSSLGAMVTINSTTPDVEVIDKNQKPAPDFNKQVQIGVDENNNPIWADSNSAEIGDKVTYKISFTATNFDGDKAIKYYQVHDEKGHAIWAEFNSFEVKVDGVPLNKGYYLNQGGNNTNNWRYLGTGWGTPEEIAALPADSSRINEADWYLVHLGYDKFRITIPWMKNHTITATSGNPIDINTSDTYRVTFPADAEHKFTSPVTVEITYDAVIEPGAAIGPTPTDKNRFNKAEASWTSEHETGTTPPDQVETKVYGIGILKDDLATQENLAGAKFEVFRDADCTDPVYVIPTNIEGVYLVDSLGKDIEKVSGEMKVDARTYVKDLLGEEKYNKVMREYLVDDEGKPVPQNNLVVSQENGKLVVLGLSEGTYYLLEVEAPAGYNAVTAPVPLTAGTGTSSFYIYANANGEVADIQSEENGYEEHKYEVTHDIVHNSQGTTLPSTGGEGAMKMIAIGTVIALGFAVLLITNKKMTAYRD